MLLIHAIPLLVDAQRTLTTLATDACTRPVSEVHWLLLHTGVFEHVGPLPTGAGMAVFQVLSEVISPEELLGLIALGELVNVLYVIDANIPVLLGCHASTSAAAWILVPTVTAHIRGRGGHG